MKYQKDINNYVVRLDKGELFLETLLKFARDKKIPGAWVSAIGGVVWAEIGFYDISSKKYIWKRFEQNMELLGARGTLALYGGEPVFHLHGTFSNRKMQTVGGHIKEAEVAATCEVFFHSLSDKPLERTINESNPVPLLDL